MTSTADQLGIGITDTAQGFRLEIPDQYRIGHEAHFALLTKQFLRYVLDPASIPSWEEPNMLAKYFVTTKGVELARRAQK